jgi:hypothetical protein
MGASVSDDKRVWIDPRRSCVSFGSSTWLPEAPVLRQPQNGRRPGRLKTLYQNHSVTAYIYFLDLLSVALRFRYRHPHVSEQYRD